MSASHQCGNCGTALPSGVLAGLCPRCVARAIALDESEEAPRSVCATTGLADGGAVGLEIGDELGQGGMGVVYAATDEMIGREMAVKFLRHEREDDPTAVERFLREGRIAGRLQHPGMVPVYQLGFTAEGRPFYAMRRIEGESLAVVLERIRREDAVALTQYPLAVLLGVFEKICDAVAYAHAHGIIHRDLKPENVMLGSFGEVLVVDWGLAKVVEPGNQERPAGETVDIPDPDSDSVHPESAAANSDHLPEPAVASPEPAFPPVVEAGSFRTMAGSVLGTPGAMAPEQARGETETADLRTDVFGLGGVLYRLLTLRPPAGGTTVREVLENTQRGYIPPPAYYNRAREINPDGTRAEKIRLRHLPGGQIPAALSAVALKALATRPQDRYQSVEELLEELRAYRKGFATAAEDAGLLVQLRLLLRRHKVFAAGLGVALLVLAGFVWHVVEVNRKEQRINTILANFRRVAPVFADQAQSLVEQQRFGESLEKIDQAITLDPHTARFHFLKGNILESLLRVAEACQAYQQTLKLEPGHALANENSQLCGKLLAGNAGRTNLSLASLTELQDAMLHQKRIPEAIAMLRYFNKEGQRRVDANKRLRDLCQILLKSAGMDAEGELQVDDDGVHLDFTGGQPLSGNALSKLKGLPLTGLAFRYSEFIDLRPLQDFKLRRLTIVGDPDFSHNKLRDVDLLRGLPLTSLRLESVPAHDVSALQGMPLTELRLEHTEIADLSPLKGASLTRLDLWDNPVEDISVLKDLPLTHVALHQTKVRDLTPLLGKRLASLTISEVPVDDLRALAGMPLENLAIDSASVRDLSPLRGMPLKVIGLGRLPVSDLSPLKGLELDQLHLSALTNVNDLSPVGAVKTRYLLLSQMKVKDLRTVTNPVLNTVVVGSDSTVTDISALAGLSLVEVVLHSTEVHDLAPLKGQQLNALDAGNCPVSDLSPLAGMSLTRLYLNDTRIADISVLQGMPLQELVLSGCTNLIDLTPLAQCRQLERLAIPKNRRNIEFLRQLPKLKSLNDDGDFSWAKPAAQFWTEFDSRRPAGK